MLNVQETERVSYFQSLVTHRGFVTLNCYVINPKVELELKKWYVRGLHSKLFGSYNTLTLFACFFWSYPKSQRWLCPSSCPWTFQRLHWHLCEGFQQHLMILQSKINELVSWRPRYKSIKTFKYLTSKSWCWSASGNSQVSKTSGWSTA